MKNSFAGLDARLSEVPFVAGDRYSVADITALATIDFAAGGLKPAIPDEQVALKRWHEKVSARPSAKA